MTEHEKLILTEKALEARKFSYVPYSNFRVGAALLTADGRIVLADEISPDTCRFWDVKTGEKLDKDRFRRDLGNVEGAYQEMSRRLLGE